MLSCVHAAYAEAADFFRERLHGAPVVFACNTWLFFERHREMLGEDSNICRFMAEYDVFSVAEYPDYSEVWRLFDKFYTGNPDDMPADSSLRRAYVALMKRGEPTGFGCGVLVYDRV